MLKSKDFWMKKPDENLKKVNCLFDIKSVKYIALTPNSYSKIKSTHRYKKNQNSKQSNSSKKLKQNNSDFNQSVNEIQINGSNQVFGLEKSIVERINEENKNKLSKKNQLNNNNKEINNIINENMKFDTISDYKMNDTKIINERDHNYENIKINNNISQNNTQNHSIILNSNNDIDNQNELPKITIIRVKNEATVKRPKVQPITNERIKEENFITSMYPFNKIGKEGFHIKELTFKEKILNKKNEKNSVLNKLMLSMNTEENVSMNTENSLNRNKFASNFNNLRNVHLKASIIKNQKEFYKKERIDIVNDFEHKIKTEINNIKRKRFDTFCPKSMFNTLSVKNINNAILGTSNINEYRGKMLSINKNVKNKLTIAPINKTRKTGFEVLSENLYYMEKAKIIQDMKISIK